MALGRALLGSRVGAVAAIFAACAPTRSTWTPCVFNDGAAPDGATFSPADNSTCPVDLRCVAFATIGQDGMCHAVAPVCAVPCHIDGDCSTLGVNTVCSRACTVIDGGAGGSGICTPFQ